MANPNVKRKGPGLEAALKRIEARAVTVGIHSDAGRHNGSKTGITVAAIGAIHEFGAPNKGIPERSFIRSTLTEKESEIKGIMKKVLENSLAGKGQVKKDMGKLGVFVEQEIKKKIVAIRTPPNAPPTIKQKKGTDNPLIDTGQLLNSIRWKFENDLD